MSNQSRQPPPEAEGDTFVPPDNNVGDHLDNSYAEILGHNVSLENVPSGSDPVSQAISRYSDTLLLAGFTSPEAQQLAQSTYSYLNRPGLRGTPLEQLSAINNGMLRLLQYEGNMSSEQLSALIRDTVNRLSGPLENQGTPDNDNTYHVRRAWSNELLTNPGGVVQRLADVLHGTGH